MRFVRFILIFVICCVGVCAFAQTPYAITQSRKADVSTSQTSVGNAWAGSTLSYALNGDQDFDDSFLFNTRIMYELPSAGKVRIPVLGSIAIPITEIDFENIEIGVYPYAIVSQKNTMTIVAHGGIRYRVRPDDSASESLQSISILAGLEFAYKPKMDQLPYTFSLTPFYDLNNLSLENDFRLEATLIVPISVGIGLLAEWDINKNGILRMGIITNSLFK